MNIKWIVWMGGMWLMLLALPAMAWQCRNGFAEPGDAAAKVRKKCGAPDFIYPQGKHANARASEVRWYYNPGSGGLLRVLRFQGGKLSVIDTAGYGFSLATKHCTPVDLRYGMSVYELVARCGQPKTKRVVASGAGGKHKHGAQSARSEVWTYDFGSQYLLQAVTLVDAQVDRVASASRSASRSRRR